MHMRLGGLKTYIDTKLGAETEKIPYIFLFRPLPRAEERYTGFFLCSDNFDRSIYSSYRVVSGIIKNPLERRIRNLNFF